MRYYGKTMNKKIEICERNNI